VELQSFLQTHKETFQTQPLFSFRQIYFNPQVHGENLHQDVTRTLERLQRSPSSAHHPYLGDPFVLQQNFDDLSLTELKNMFGDQFTSATSALLAGSWQGPIASGHRGA